MRRLFWLAMGITMGALIVRRLTKVAERLTPKSLVDSVGAAVADLADEIGNFVSDVRESMREREHELREGTGLNGTSR